MRVSDENYNIDRRIKFLVENKISHLAPTISPAPKNPIKGEIESLELGIKELLKRSSRIIMQPKYMGSYCDVYLHKNIEDSYLVSKSGYLVKNIDKETMVEMLKPLHDKIDWNYVNLYIIQAELMPWSTLGKGLIEYEYRPYVYAKEHKTYDLLSYDFMLDEVFDSDDYINADYNKPHIRRQYNALNKLKDMIPKDVDGRMKGFSVFRKQLDIHGKLNEKPYLKPFGILGVYSNYGENLAKDYSQIDNFKLVSDDPYMIIDKYTDINLVYEVYNAWMSKGMEGVVLKTEFPIYDGPTMFKVRNNDFLHLLYGEDFLEKMDTHIEERNINKKLKSSIIDFKMGHELLKINRNEITQDNYKLKNLYLNKIKQEQEQSDIDDRL